MAKAELAQHYLAEMWSAKGRKKVSSDPETIARGWQYLKEVRVCERERKW